MMLVEDTTRELREKRASRGGGGGGESENDPRREIGVFDESRRDQSSVDFVHVV